MGRSEEAKVTRDGEMKRRRGILTGAPEGRMGLGTLFKSLMSIDALLPDTFASSFEPRVLARLSFQNRPRCPPRALNSLNKVI